MTDYATEWRAAGACLSADPELFFPIAEGSAADRQISTALRVCAGCAVRQQCLDFAMADRRGARHLGRHHGRRADPRPAQEHAPPPGTPVPPADAGRPRLLTGYASATAIRT